MERLSNYRFQHARDFARIALALGHSASRRMSVKEMVGDVRLVEMAESAADERGALDHATKASPVSTATSPFDDDWLTASGEFMSIIDENSLSGRLPAAHPMPFAVRTMAPGSDAMAAWVADRAAKVVSELSLVEVAMPVRKVASIIVLTNDVIEAAPVDAQRMTLTAATRAVRMALDTVFISGDAATSATPAGLLNDAQTVASTGSTAAAIALDLANMVANLNDSRIALAGANWIMSPAGYAFLRLLKVADPDGTVGGFPVLTSDAADGVCALVASQYVGVARSDRVILGTTGHASLDMAGGNSPTFSLWQRNCTGIKAEVFANWALFGPTDSSGNSLAVVTLTGASWT